MTDVVRMQVDLETETLGAESAFSRILIIGVHDNRGLLDALTGDDLRTLHAPYFESLKEEVEELNRAYGKPVLSVVAVGQALIALRERIKAGQAPGLRSQEDLFTDPLGHPALPVQVLAAYNQFAVIYRRSPVGLALPSVLNRAGSTRYPEELNRLLQELAWSAALEHPLSRVLEIG